LGNPSVANADNHLSEPGAVWDFTATLKNGELQKKENSATKDLIFKVDHPLSLLDNGRVRPDLIVGDIRVLASRPQLDKEPREAGAK
jgi:hypothetical protein